MNETDVQNALANIRGSSRTKRADAAVLAAVALKYCRSCDTVRPLSAFGKRARATDGLGNTCNVCRLEYREENREYDRVQSRKNYHAKINENRATVRKWQAANRDVARAACRTWRANNPEAQKKAGQKWRTTNPGKNAALAAKRHAAVRHRTPKWLTPDDLRYIQNMYVEAADKTKQTGVQWHVDHKIPLQGQTVSGLHVPWNLQVIPAIDNVKKGNRHE